VVSSWTKSLGEWDIRDTFCLANIGATVNEFGETTWIGRVRPNASPNFDMNYENVVFMGAGRFYGEEDTTFNAETMFTTPIPSIVLLQHGRLGHEPAPSSFLPTIRVLQVFTVESRPFRVRDPLDERGRRGDLYRQHNVEGLGVVTNAGGMVVPSKYDIMVDSASTEHPTVLRYDDRTLDATRVRGIVVADVSGDVRDEVVLFYDSGTDTRVIRLQNDSVFGHENPLDYILTRYNDATVDYGVVDVRDLRHAVAGRFTVGAETSLHVALFLRNDDGDQRIVMARPGTPWTFTEVSTPVDSTEIDFDALDGVVRADLDGDGNDEIVFLEQRAAATTVGRIVSGTWAIDTGTARHVFSSTVAAAGRVTAIGAGDLDGNGTDEVVVAARRQNAANAASLVVVSHESAAWHDTTAMRAGGATHVDGTMMRHLVVGNLDYDVRRRADVAVLYHGDIDTVGVTLTKGREDRLLLWRSLPRHGDNDYALSIDTGQGPEPFIPLGWFGLRLSSGLNPMPTPDVIHITDYWRRLEGWRGADEHRRVSGYRYAPDSGRVSEALLGEYAGIYNTIVSERQNYTDGYIYGGNTINDRDNGSAMYYHNVQECGDGLLATLERADAHNLMVMPYLGFHLPHTYNVNGAQRLWHLWQTTEGSAAAGNMPQFVNQLMSNPIQQHTRFLGWYGVDEPTNLLNPATWTDFRSGFSAPQPDAAPLNLSLRDTLRSFYRSVQWRNGNSPVFMNYHMPLDFEYYRNCHDVAMFDFYVHAHVFKLTFDTVGTIERLTDRVALNNDNVDQGIMFSLNPRLRSLMQHVIRTDKVAAIHIGQGVGDDYSARDFDASTTPPRLLRTYPYYRNLTHAEARYLLYAPAAIGVRGAIWWEGSTWMAGSDPMHWHTEDANFRVMGPLDGAGNREDNIFGRPMHYNRNNFTQSSIQKRVVDRASAEFKHYLPIFANESLDGRVSTEQTLSRSGIYYGDVVTSLHLDSATMRYWLFVVNMSNRSFEHLAITVNGIPSNSAVWAIGPEYWTTPSDSKRVYYTWADTAVTFSTSLQKFDVKIFALHSVPPQSNPTTVAVDGELAWANQRKLVAYPAHNPNSLGQVPDSTADSVRYHMVYMRTDCDTCPPVMSGHRVYYRRSLKMSAHEATAAIRWESAEHTLSLAVLDHVDTSSTKVVRADLTCGYPSLVVRYDSALGRARVHVVYACHSGDVHTAPFEHAETAQEGTIRIVEHIFDADAPTQAIDTGQVIGPAMGSTIHEYGFPVIGAATLRNGYSWSCSDRGIVAGMKLPGEPTFTTTNMFRTIKGATDNGVGAVISDNHPGIASYTASPKSIDELPFVWTSGDGSRQINYSRMRWLGAGGCNLYAPSPTNAQMRRLAFDRGSLWTLGYPNVLRTRALSDSPVLSSASKQALDAWNESLRRDHIVYSQVLTEGWAGFAGSGSVESRVLTTVDSDSNPQNDNPTWAMPVTYVHKFYALVYPNLTTASVSNAGIDTTQSQWPSTLHTAPILSFTALDTIKPLPYQRLPLFRLGANYTLRDSMPGPSSYPIVDNVHWMRFADSLGYTPKRVIEHHLDGAQPNQAERPRHEIAPAYASTRIVIERDTSSPTPAIVASVEPYMKRADPNKYTHVQEVRSYALVQGSGGMVGITDLAIGGRSPALRWLGNGNILTSDTVTIHGVVRGSATMIVHGSHNHPLVLRRVDSIASGTVKLVDIATLSRNTEHALTFTALVDPGRYVLEINVEDGWPLQLILLGSQPTPGNRQATTPAAFEKTASMGAHNVVIDARSASANDLLVYPIPASTSVTIVCPATITNEAVLSIHSANGLRAYQSTGTNMLHTVDVAEWPSGRYDILWQSGNIIVSAQLVLAR